MGAPIDLERAEEAAAKLDQTRPQQLLQRDTVVQLLTLRLAEAVASRELLLRELAAVIRQEANCSRVVVIEPDEGGRQRVVIAHGYVEMKPRALILMNLRPSEKQGRKFEVFAKKHNVAIIKLKSTNAPPATLLIYPRERATLPGGLSLDPLLRVVELEWMCALHKGSCRSGVRRQAPWPVQV